MKKTILNLVLTAMFFAMGLVLPFLTGQVPQIGNMLLPMHIPVFLCSLICGWQYALPLGFALPLVRSLIFTMPIMYPSAIAMAFELATYGLVAGLLYKKARWQCVRSLCRCLAAAMLAGRVVWAVAQAILLAIGGGVFTFEAFLAGAFLNAIPGIILQFILIPSVMLALDKTHLVPMRKGAHKENAST